MSCITNSNENSSTAWLYATSEARRKRLEEQKSLEYARQLQQQEEEKVKNAKKSVSSRSNITINNTSNSNTINNSSFLPSSFSQSSSELNDELREQSPPELISTIDHLNQGYYPTQGTDIQSNRRHNNRTNNRTPSRTTNRTTNRTHPHRISQQSQQLQQETLQQQLRNNLEQYQSRQFLYPQSSESKQESRTNRDEMLASLLSYSDSFPFSSSSSSSSSFSTVSPYSDSDSSPLSSPVRSLRSSFINSSSSSILQRNIPDANDYEGLLALGELIGDVKPKNKPATQATISALPISQYTNLSNSSLVAKKSNSEINQQPNSEVNQKPNSNDKQEEIPTCRICLNEFTSGQAIKTLPCFDKFCPECIDPWLKTNELCPICRHPVSEFCQSK